MTGRDLPEFLTADGMTADAPIRTPSDVYRVVALIAAVLQSMERDTTTTSLLAAPRCNTKPRYGWPARRRLTRG
ncbi:hypothetical protein [Cryobacterium sp. SO1]|uniref:hypothetical protein n=1 Tax=Cryobacterium sp. SO1 TaxID=1897061 RepID=UPI001022AADB|nr:hypothetical protein [Cryobacterium sp. SO1]